MAAQAFVVGFQKTTGGGEDQARYQKMTGGGGNPARYHLVLYYHLSACEGRGRTTATKDFTILFFMENIRKHGKSSACEDSAIAIIYTPTLTY